MQNKLKLYGSLNRKIANVSGCAFAVVFLLLSFVSWSDVQAQVASVHYNDLRTVVILPNLTQTQRIDEPAVNNETRKFCSDENYFYISSSSSKRKVTHNYSAYLQFDLNAIPKDAIIDSVALLIYLKEVKNKTSKFEQFVNLYELSQPRGNAVINIADSTSAAMVGVAKNDLLQAVNLQLEIPDGANWATKRNYNLYWILAAEESETMRYFTERSGDLSKQPKLVIQYHMPENQVRKSNWPQYKYDAQHTAMLPWRSNADATLFKMKEVFSPAGANYIMSDPILYDGKLLFAYQSSATPMYSLKSISTQGQLLAETSVSDTIGLVKFTPVVDRNSALFCVTGNAGNVLTVLDANNLKLIKKKVLENSAQTIALPVVGFDGSVYLSTSKGIYAYTPQPELKLKWVYATPTNRFGTVTLDEQEKALYVYDGTEGNIKAFNNTDGMLKWSVGGMGKFENEMPVPVVKNGFLYVTNGIRLGDRFFIINTSDGRVVKSVSGNKESISQPVAGMNNVFIINDGKLESYNASLELKQHLLPQSLNPASTLATDTDNNVYLLNTEKGKQSFTLVPQKSTVVPVVNISDASGFLTGNRLILSTEGDAFAGNNNHIYRFSPSGFSVKVNITIPAGNANQFQSEFLYRSEGTITLAGKTINSTQNVVVHSGTAIVFQTGFSVKTGATLNCRTGY